MKPKKSVLKSILKNLILELFILSTNNNTFKKKLLTAFLHFDFFLMSTMPPYATTVIPIVLAFTSVTPTVRVGFTHTVRAGMNLGWTRWRHSTAVMVAIVYTRAPGGTFAVWGTHVSRITHVGGRCFVGCIWTAFVVPVVHARSTLAALWIHCTHLLMRTHVRGLSDCWKEQPKRFFLKFYITVTFPIIVFGWHILQFNNIDYNFFFTKSLQNVLVMFV